MLAMTAMFPSYVPGNGDRKPVRRLKRAAAVDRWHLKAWPETAADFVFAAAQLETVRW